MSGAGKVQVRRVLMIGGIMDGKWHTHEGNRQVVEVMKPMRISMAEIRGDHDLEVPLPQFERYYLEKVALYGEGLWVGIYQGALTEAFDEMGQMMGGWREPRITLILKAILQRDVATEMGL